MSQPGLPWFLARLEEALRQGRAPDAAWLCEGRPELIPLVEQVLEHLRHFAPHAQPAETLVGGQAGLAAPLQPTLTGSSSHAGQPAAPPLYEILGVLGRGGMGVVYRARQIRLNRVVALKMILAGSHANPEDQARFLTEAEAVAAIQHPGIVQVYTFGTYEGLPYMAMELCPGGSLAQKLAGTPLPPKEAAALVAQMARAIQAAHDKGIVHRDLKPANILLAADGSPRVTDFGLAKRVAFDSGLTQTGALLGTPSYMAPEQAKASKHTGPPADIYALGAILYECLAGRPPFKGATAVETLQQVMDTEPVSVRTLQPRVPRDLETICHKALHKEPARRYATAADLAADLDRFLAGEPVLARPVGPLERGWKWVKRRPVVTGLFAAFVLSLVGGMASTSRWALIAGQREQLARQREQEVRDALDAAGRIAVLLASNVLAPIGPPEVNREGHRDQGMSPAELAAIEGLAQLPRAIDRVELIRRILDNPATVRKLSWRLQPVLRALVELDLGRRDAVLGVVRPCVLGERGDEASRLVCARIFARLSGDDDPAARAATGLLLDAVGGPLPPGEQIAALEDLAHLAPHLSNETADWLCGRILAAARDAPPDTLRLLATAYNRSNESLPPGRQRHGKLAHELMARLTRQAGEETGELTLWHTLHAFAVVGVRLDPDEARKAVARLVQLAELGDRPATVEAAGEVVRVLADKLDDPARRDADTRLAALAIRLVPKTTDEWYLDGLARALTGTLPGADTGRLAKVLADALAAKPAARQLLALAPAFPALTKRLPAGQASRLSAAFADLLAPHVLEPGTPVTQDRLVKAFTAAAVGLDAAAARARLSLAVKLVEVGRPEQLALAAEVAAALAGHVQAGERELILARIDAAVAARLAGLLDDLAVSRLGRAVAAVAPLEPALGRRLAGRLDVEVGRLLPNASSPDGLALLARGLGAVAPWLGEEARRRRVDELTERLSALVRPDSPLAELRALREAADAVRPWITPNRLGQMREAFAPTAVRQVAQDKWMTDVQGLLDRALSPLPAAELVAILRQPSCIGPSEKAVLRALGDRVGRTFHGVWDAARWLAENRPDIDLTGPAPAAGAAP
jgi:hypothetical protein